MHQSDTSDRPDSSSGVSDSLVKPEPPRCASRACCSPALNVNLIEGVDLTGTVEKGEGVVCVIAGLGLMSVTGFSGLVDLTRLLSSFEVSPKLITASGFAGEFTAAIFDLVVRVADARESFETDGVIEPLFVADLAISLSGDASSMRLYTSRVRRRYCSSGLTLLAAVAFAVLETQAILSYFERCCRSNHSRVSCDDTECSAKPVTAMADQSRSSQRVHQRTEASDARRQGSLTVPTL